MPATGSTDAPDGTRTLPRIGGVLTMFYYDDVRTVAAWYRDLIGFAQMVDWGWCVILRIRGDSYLALIEGNFGSQTPIAGRNKGAILSIETDDVATWHARLAAARVVGAETGVFDGCDGRTREFKVYDPSGYTLEFFQWRDPNPFADS